MSEPTPASTPTAAQAAAPEAAPTKAPDAPMPGNPLPSRVSAWWTRERIAIAALVVLFLVNWWDTRRQIDALSQEVAQRLRAEGETLQQQSALAREAQERVREAGARLAALEAKLAESQSQQVALENLYQDLSRNRDDWALTEIEQALTIASQQLQLAGNVRGALIALQNADQRLGRADKAQFIAVRRALQKDIDRLKNLPFVDTVGMAIRLDAVIAGIDSLPLLFDERSQPAPRAGRAAPKEGKSAPKEAEPSAWQRLRDDAWEQFKQLIRIRDIGAAEPVLLSPSQAFFVRENLKLRLLNARIALLQRNEALFRGDVDTAALWINRYVDVRSKNGANALATLRTLSAAAVSIELPVLSESLNAVRNYKAPARPAGK